jgi:hypothetical protein
MPAAIMLATLMALPVHALDEKIATVQPALLEDTNSGSNEQPDESPRLIAVGDFNRDGIPDLVQATPPMSEDSDQRFLTMSIGLPNGTFKTLASRNLIGKNPSALIVGDFNGDGNADVIVGDSDGTLLEFLGDGKGNLRDEGKIAALGSVVSIATGHFTRDNRLGLVVSDLQSNTAAILLNTGNGSFRLAWSFELPRKGRPFRIAATDFNHDGIADLVISSDEDSDYEVMLGNGNGTFTYAPALSHVRDPNSYCPS